LTPDDPDALAVIQGIKEGMEVQITVAKPRNAKFHRKYFALLNTAYELWDCPIGVEGASKDLKAFRGEIIVLSGYRDMVVKLDGTVKYTPRSISFGKMTEDEFGKLYSSSVDVILSKVLTNYKRADLDNAIQKVMNFT